MPASSQVSKVKLPTLPEFRTRRVRRIDFFSGNTVGVSPLGQNVCSDGGTLAKGYLVLFVNSATRPGYFIEMPLLKLSRVSFANTDTFSFDNNDFNDLLIDWDKSYIEFPATHTTGTDFNTLLFTVYYN